VDEPGIECFTNTVSLGLRESTHESLPGNQRCFFSCSFDAGLIVGSMSDPFVEAVTRLHGKVSTCDTANCNDPSTINCGGSGISKLEVIMCPFSSSDGFQMSLKTKDGQGKVTVCLAYCLDGEVTYEGVNDLYLYTRVEADYDPDSLEEVVADYLGSFDGTLLKMCHERGCMDDPSDRGFVCKEPTAAPSSTSTSANPTTAKNPAIATDTPTARAATSPKGVDVDGDELLGGTANASVMIPSMALIAASILALI
jgi:hypothetical protein